MIMNKTKIKVGIIGVGNCASSLIQGVSYYSENKDKNKSGHVSTTRWPPHEAKC